MKNTRSKTNNRIEKSIEGMKLKKMNKEEQKRRLTEARKIQKGLNLFINY